MAQWRHGSAKEVRVFSRSDYLLPQLMLCTIAGAGQWVLLTFPTRIQMNMIYLYDRGNINDQIASGMLTFDDGSALSVGALNNDGELVLVQASWL